MKRYWVFVWDRYYPLGGMHDFLASYDDEQTALENVYNIILDPEGTLQHYQVFDSETKKVLHEI